MKSSATITITQAELETMIESRLIQERNYPDRSRQLLVAEITRLRAEVDRLRAASFGARWQRLLSRWRE